MLNIDAKDLDFQTINEKIKSTKECKISGLVGRRFIAAGTSNKSITLSGTPGNALAAYLNGGQISVIGNAQDAVGDTMNNGEIIIHGNVGDAVGYAMRGGKIFVKGNAGYRVGIHIKEYKETKPIIVIGGCVGSFAGEYQAGGIIIVLGINKGTDSIIGSYPCTGMYGGVMLLRDDCTNVIFPKNICAKAASNKDIEPYIPYLKEFCKHFNLDPNTIINSNYTIVTPNANNPYKQMYVTN